MMENTVNARDMWAFLGSKQQFADWVKKRIAKHGFTQGVDFTVINNFVKDDTKFGGKKTVTDYHMTINMAKKVAMMENTVNARDMWAFLGSNQQFADWVKKRITQHGFTQGVDFTVFHKSMKNPKGGAPTKDYHLTLNMAKKVALMENTAVNAPRSP